MRNLGAYVSLLMLYASYFIITENVEKRFKTYMEIRTTKECMIKILFCTENTDTDTDTEKTDTEISDGDGGEEDA